MNTSCFAESEEMSWRQSSGALAVLLCLLNACAAAKSAGGTGSDMAEMQLDGGSGVGRQRGAKHAKGGGGAKADSAEEEDSGRPLGRSCRGDPSCHPAASAEEVKSTATALAALLRLSEQVPVLRSLEDIQRVASAIATRESEIIYTTVTMDRGLFQLVFLRQWQGNLRGAAAHTLLVGVDERTCAVARNATIPCFVDGVAPPLSGKQNMFGSQVLLKWWYAKTLLSLGFQIIFSDPDIAWLSNPFARWQHDSWRAFDLQGLSDIRSPNLTVQKHHEITCMRPWMESMYEHGRRSIYPCQSTGLWYMRNRPSSRAMLEGLYGYLRARPNEWEQKAFQLVVVRYLIGLGDDLPPLRYRLLPTNQFINIEYYRERLRLGMSVADMTGVHCGYLKNTADKLEFLEYYGFLHRGLAHHRRVYQDVVALGEVGHGRTFGDSRMYGASDATVQFTLPRKDHSKFSIEFRRRQLR